MSENKLEDHNISAIPYLLHSKGWTNEKYLALHEVSLTCFTACPLFLFSTKKMRWYFTVIRSLNIGLNPLFLQGWNVGRCCPTWDSSRCGEESLQNPAYKHHNCAKVGQGYASEEIWKDENTENFYWLEQRVGCNFELWNKMLRTFSVSGQSFLTQWHLLFISALKFWNISDLFCLQFHCHIRILIEKGSFIKYFVAIQINS